MLSVTDVAGSRISLEWNDMGVRVHTPQRADGVTPLPVVVETDSRGIVLVTDSAEATTRFEYDDAELLVGVVSSGGLATLVDYQTVGRGEMAAREVTVRDDEGRELSRRSWSVVGEKLFSGFPIYRGGESALWSSGDGGFRYRTRVSDGVAHVDSTYNSMGLLVERSRSVSTGAATAIIREEIL